MDELVPSAKEVKPKKKGKTREEVELQGGPLSTKLNEQKIGRILDEHNIEWEYNDNGGITAIEEFSKGPSRKKYFKSNTSLKTIRNWLGYAKGGVVDMRNGGRVRMKDGGELTPAYVRSFLSDIFTNTDEEIRDESYFDENEQNALLQVVKNSRKRHGENKGSIDYERDYPEGFKGIYYGGSSDLLTKNPFQSVKKTLGGFSWSYDPEKKEYFITDRYNFNDAEKIQKMYPNALNKAVAFAKEIGTRAATGQLGMYGIARTTGKYYGSKEGKGAQFLIRLSDKKKV
jgi:hypothetical protein